MCVSLSRFRRTRVTSFSPHSSLGASSEGAPDGRPLAAIVVNPRARRTGSAGWRDAVVNELSKRYAVESHESQSAQDVTELSAHFARLGAALVVAAGGDGTINRVVRGIAGTATSLGILPLGTANDLAREIGIPHDVTSAARLLVETSSPHRIDVVTANGIPYVTVGGLTLVSQSAMLVNRLKATRVARGAANALAGGVYRLAATAKLLGGRRIRTRLHVEYEDDDGSARTIDVHAHALFVTNHRTLGGGLRLPVEGNAHDGLFELAWVPVRSRLSLTINFARLSAGTPLAPGVLEVVRARRAVVHTDHEDAFVADGELLATGREFDLAVRPRALSVYSSTV